MSYIQWIYVALLLLLLLIPTACSNSGDPVAVVQIPSSGVESRSTGNIHASFYRIECHPDGAIVIPLRQANMNLNVLMFLEPPPQTNVQIIAGPNVHPEDNRLADITIGLRHPFTGMTEFTGFDVKGVVFADGFSDSIFLETTNLGGKIFTQTFHDGFSTSNILVENPDGYTDIFNPLEYPFDGTWQSYKDGLLGTPDSFANYPYTVNPFKYFSDDLSASAALNYLNLSDRGMFTPGETNSRKYVLRNSKPWSMKIPVFNYAVVTSWEMPVGLPPWDPVEDFPPDANQNNPLFLDVSTTGPGLTSQGGNTHIDCRIIDWQDDPVAVRLEAPGIFLGQRELNPIGVDHFEIDITNELGAPAGMYSLMLTAESDGPAGKSFHLLEKEVTSEQNSDWSTPTLITNLSAFFAFPHAIIDPVGRVWAFWVDDTAGSGGQETWVARHDGTWGNAYIIAQITGDGTDGPYATTLYNQVYLSFSDCPLHPPSPDVLVTTFNTLNYSPGTFLPYVTVSDISPEYNIASGGVLDVHFAGSTEIVTSVWLDNRPEISPYGDILLKQRLSGVWQDYVNVSDDSAVSQHPSITVTDTDEIYISWYDLQGGNKLCRWNGVYPFEDNAVHTDLPGRPVDISIHGSDVYLPVLTEDDYSRVCYINFPAGTDPSVDPVEVTNVPATYYGTTITSDGDVAIFTGNENISGHVIAGDVNVDLMNIIPQGFTLWTLFITVNPNDETYHLIFEADYDGQHGLYHMKSL